MEKTFVEQMWLKTEPTEGWLTGGESEDRESDEVMDSEQNDWGWRQQGVAIGRDIKKSGLWCSEKDVNGRARLAKDE